MPRLALLALLASCGGPPCEQALAPATDAAGAGMDVFASYSPEGCTPDKTAFDTLVLPVVEARCSACHGEEPAFGAPSSLMTYDALVAGTPGTRQVDRMAHRVASKTMPPPDSPALAHEDVDLLVEWATCGEVHPDHGIGMQVDREIYAASKPEHLELPSFDVAARDFEVGREVLDEYHCFAVDVPFDEPRFVKRFQMVLDDPRVLHHAVLIHDPDGMSAGRDHFECLDWPPIGTDQIWAWAPGGGPFDFEDGGLQLDPGDRVVVQIHYNNGAGLDDVIDSSGVRLFHDTADGIEWDLGLVGPEFFELEPGDSAICDTAKVRGPLRVLAGAPHMHELGRELSSWITRKDTGLDEPMLSLTGWNFEAQRYYRLDLDLAEGDKVHTRCGFRNDTGGAVAFGEGTTDEMCYHFLFVSDDPAITGVLAD